jgi:hypothetical protein
LEQQSREELKRVIREVLVSKMEEFQMLGYNAVTEDELWECVTSKYKKEWPQLSQVVNDVYSLKPNSFMNWLTMQAFKGKLT